MMYGIYEPVLRRTLKNIILLTISKNTIFPSSHRFCNITRIITKVCLLKILEIESKKMSIMERYSRVNRLKKNIEKHKMVKTVKI